MPELPSVFKNSYDDFFLKTALRCKDSGNTVNLIRRSANTEDDKLNFIIDIDVFKRNMIQTDNIRNEFEILRNDKNEIFESLITDKSRELFK